MDGEPYVVSVGKRAVRKVVSDPHLSAEKLAVLEDIEKVIANGEYVGSGEYNQKGKKEKDTVRYDYFETPVSINGTDYVVTFDVEVFSNANNYRTHKVINEMDITPISDTDDAPVASAAEMALSPSSNSISQNAENSNNNILGDGESFEKGQENTSSTVFDGPPSPQGEGFLNPSTADAVPLPLGKGGSRRGKLGSAKAVADILSSAYGVKFSEYSAEDGLNGYYDPQTRVIYINQLSDEPVLATVSHELIHDLKVNDPGAFSLLRQIVNSDMNLEKFNKYKKELLAAYDAIGKDYSGMTEVELYEHVLEEAMADLCSEVMRDPSTITRIAKADRNLAQRIMDKLGEILETIQRAFSEYFGGETLEVRELVNNFVEVKAVYQSVLENSAKRGLQSEGTSGEVKSSIETLPDGKRYVQADRKVISGDDPKAWGEQVKSYINKEIRKGKNVVVYGIDGDPLTITADTSGKAKFRNIITEKDGTERPMTNREYAVKLRAESHIDEVSQVSKRGKKDVPDEKNHPFAKDGFNYRTAYFMDEDGSYYRLTISVGKNGEVNTVYNVGKLKEAPFPLSGSKAGRNSVYGGTSNNSIPQSNGAVNTSIRSEQQNDTSFDKPMSVSRKQRATEAIAKYKETGDVRDLPERAWAKGFRRDTENRSRYLANQMQDLEYQLTYADEESRKSIEGAINTLRKKIEDAAKSAGIVVELNDVLDNATLNRNVDLAPVIGELKDTDTGLKLKNGNYRFNDFYRNLERFFGKHFHLVKPLIDGFDSAKGDFARMQVERLAEMQEYIVKELGIKPGSKESKAVQWIGEKQRNPLTKKEVAEVDRIVEAQAKEKGLSKKQASELKKSLRVDYTEAMLRNEFDDATVERILKAERWFRQQYEELIDEINRTQRLIYPNRPDKQIPKRQDYMRHFREMETGIRGLRNIFDADHNIDPKLVLVSDHTKPKEKWASIKQQREGNVTDEGAIEGFLDYLPQAAYAIHINPYIDKFRGLARDIAELKAETGDTSANGFVKYLNDFASHIAGKSDSLDRDLIDRLGSNGRKFIKSLNWFNNRVKSNAVLGNIGSVSKQVMNIPNGVELLHNPAGIFQGILDVVAGVAEGAKGTTPQSLRDSSPDKGSRGKGSE